MVDVTFSASWQNNGGCHFFSFGEYKIPIDQPHAKHAFERSQLKMF